MRHRLLLTLYVDLETFYIIYSEYKYNCLNTKFYVMFIVYNNIYLSIANTLIQFIGDAFNVTLHIYLYVYDIQLLNYPTLYFANGM